MPAELVASRGGFLVIDYATGRSAGVLDRAQQDAHLEVALAYANGAEVEFQAWDGTWILCDGVPAFWADRRFRVAQHA